MSGVRCPICDVRGPARVPIGWIWRVAGTRTGWRFTDNREWYESMHADRHYEIKAVYE